MSSQRSSFSICGRDNLSWRSNRCRRRIWRQGRLVCEAQVQHRPRLRPPTDASDWPERGDGDAQDNVQRQVNGTAHRVHEPQVRGAEGTHIGSLMAVAALGLGEVERRACLRTRHSSASVGSALHPRNVLDGPIPAASIASSFRLRTNGSQSLVPLVCTKVVLPILQLHPRLSCVLSPLCAVAAYMRVIQL